MLEEGTRCKGKRKYNAFQNITSFLAHLKIILYVTVLYCVTFRDRRLGVSYLRWLWCSKAEEGNKEREDYKWAQHWHSFRNLHMVYTQRKHTNKAKTGNTKHSEKNMTIIYTVCNPIFFILNTWTTKIQF